MKLLLELLEINAVEVLKESLEGKDLEKIRPHVDKISQMLFNQNCDMVRDKKRSKDPIFFGVTNTESTITNVKDKFVKLTFDNSTDSGEFEINSLSALMIEKASDLDRTIDELFKKYKVNSKKKVNYISREGKTVIREIHIGVNPDIGAVKFVKDVLSLFKNNKINRSVE